MAREPFKNAPLLTHEELLARLGEFDAAVAQYNDGWYFESHETLEDLWMVTPHPERLFFQAIIQLAAAFVHYARGEHPGILKLLDASADKLSDAPDLHFGIDVGALRSAIDRARGELAVIDPGQLAQWDEGRRPYITRIGTT